MKADKNNLIKEYYKKVYKANKELTKKEAFKDLLNRLYGNDKTLLKIIDKITLGAETNILNIPRKDKFHRGSADTLYNKVIIEFENDLKVSLEHSKLQLAGYFLGQYNSGEGFNFILIASDFITWKVFSPDLSQIDRLDSLNEDELILNEIKSASFVLNENNTEDFYYWLDRFLFREEKQKATLKRIEESFGYQSQVFIECFREMSDWFSSAKKFGEVQVSFEQWEKFLSLAYGSFDAKEDVFIIHTYLSVFSKLLAYSFFSNDDYIDDTELKAVLDGSIFNKYNINNFVENDFYHWVVNDKNFRNLRKSFRLISQEISSFDFNSVDEDILKGVYQELIDVDTRHALGEYYTPDWLCERILKELDVKEGQRILDPSCGSGSFLRAAVHRLKEINPKLKPEQINNQIFGIDIHPLSVQIAKTNLLLALGKDIIHSKRPVFLNIYLANTLLAPEGITDLFGKAFRLSIDKRNYELDIDLLSDPKLFDEALEFCDQLAEQTMGEITESPEIFNGILNNKFKDYNFNKSISESFYHIYQGFKVVKENGRDSIWRFIVQNLYKPYFLSQSFDYVIGNPPWFTYSSVKNGDYQNILNDLALKYDLKPERTANFPHLEIAAIFLAHCVNYFLKEKGKLSFVLPRSFFSADHHDNTRSGKINGVKLTEIWDLEKLSPLFRVPSCVLFAQRKFSSQKKQISNSLKGIVFSGKLPNHNCNLGTAKEYLNESAATFYYIKQGKSSAFSTRKLKTKQSENPYKRMFKQGATIVPRSFYFVELDQDTPPDYVERILNLKTSESVLSDAKLPWKNYKFSGQIESSFLFITALAKSILPFHLHNPNQVILPIKIEKDIANRKNIVLQTYEDIKSLGSLFAAKWFKNTENIWDVSKTEKSKSMSSLDRLNFQRGLTEQNLNAPYLVIYNSSAKDANAVCLKRKDFDLEFIVESKAYCFETYNIFEGYYLTSILNSKMINYLIKDFQTRGLFGARDVHKKILDIFFPLFDPENDLHIKLSKLGENCHLKAKKYIEENPPSKELSASQLGRLRLRVKKHLSEELDEIDKLVKKII